MAFVCGLGEWLALVLVFDWLFKKPRLGTFLGLSSCVFLRALIVLVDILSRLSSRAPRSGSESAFSKFTQISLSSASMAASARCPRGLSIMSNLRRSLEDGTRDINVCPSSLSSSEVMVVGGDCKSPARALGVAELWAALAA